MPLSCRNLTRTVLNDWCDRQYPRICSGDLAVLTAITTAEGTSAGGVFPVTNPEAGSLADHDDRFASHSILRRSGLDVQCIFRICAGWVAIGLRRAVRFDQRRRDSITSSVDVKVAGVSITCARNRRPSSDATSSLKTGKERVG